MKKILLIAAATAVALSSCSKDEVTTSAGDNTPVSFDVYTGVSTKGTETTSTSIIASTATGFGVFGFYTDETAWAGSTETPNFMYNQKVNSTDGLAWSYSPIKYWPNETSDYISFFAYAPYSASAMVWTTATGMKGEPSGVFTLDTDVDDMVDFVAGSDLNVVKQADAVSFTLAHELTRVDFSAKTDETIASGTTVVVKSVTLSDAASTGCLYESATYTYAVTETTGAWSSQGATATSIEISETASPATFAGETLNLGSSSDYKVTGVSISDSSTALLSSGNYLFLLPVSSLAADNIKVTVVYDVVTTDSSLANASYSAIENTQVVYLPEDVLVQGTAYDFCLSIGIDQVKLAATVTAWTTPATETAVSPETTTGGDSTSGTTETES